MSCAYGISSLYLISQCSSSHPTDCIVFEMGSPIDNLTAVLYGKNDLRLECRTIRHPTSTQVLIRIGAVGICGSDVSYWTKGGIGKYLVTKPIVLGHEAAGVIVEVGSEVKTLSVGDRVAIEPGVPCRMCRWCKSGKYNLCPEIYKARPPAEGSLTRFYTHEADFCHKLPSHVSVEEGALLEPLSVGVHACNRAGVTIGSSVLICGAGPIGLVCLLVAKAMGATTVIVTDLSQDRLAMANRIGADAILNVGGKDETTLDEQVCMLNGGEFVDVSIECTGVQSSIALCIRNTMSGGVVLLVGLSSTPNVSIPVVEAAVREVDIKGVFRYGNAGYAKALALVASGRIALKELISHRFDLEDTLNAFEKARSGTAMKIVIGC